jgi:hypothetical protein
MDFDRYVELSGFIADNWFHWSATPGVQPAAQGETSDWTARNKRVHLRERSSRRFYAAHQEWVAEKDRAMDFERIELAEAVATAERLKEVEIVLAYNEPQCELTVPIAFPGVRRA